MADLSAARAYPSPPHFSSPTERNPSIQDPYDQDVKIMSSSMTPPSAGGYGGNDKSPLSTLNLGFLKSLTDKRTTRGRSGAGRDCAQSFALGFGVS